jgi:hypothetical protein
MPMNLTAAALLATGMWAAAAYSVLTHDGSLPREFWTVTASEKNPKHPTLARAHVPRQLAIARSTQVAGLSWSKH